MTSIQAAITTSNLVVIAAYFGFHMISIGGRDHNIYEDSCTYLAFVEFF